MTNRKPDAPLPPHSEAAETGLIGAVLLDSARLLAHDHQARIADLPPAAFYIPAHRTTWEAVRALHLAGKPVDLLTVTDRLRAGGHLEAIGGAVALDRIIDACPTAAHASHYAEQVAALYRSRLVAQAAAAVQAAAMAGEDIAAAMAALTTAATPRARPGLTTANAAQYISDAPPPHDPVFAGLIDRGDKGGIIAKAKTRKTYFGLQMAVCAATGRDFLGYLPAQQWRVLYCNYEIRPAHVWRRIHYIARALRIDARDIGDRLQIANLRGTEATLDDVTHLCGTVAADLIVLDPLYKVVKSGDENKAETLKPYLDAFDRLCERTGACLWYVHHDTKGQAGDRDARDRGSGSSILNRDFDCCLTLTDHADGDDMLVVHALPRNYPSGPDVTIRWEDGAFAVSDVAPKPATSQHKPSKYKDKITAYRAAHPDASVRETAKAVGCSPSAVHKWWDVADGEGL